MTVIIGLADDDATYVDIGLRPECETRTFTVFVNYYTRDGWLVDTEPIAVEAIGPIHAKEIAAAAVTRDFDPSGKIAYVEEEMNYEG